MADERPRRDGDAPHARDDESHGKEGVRHARTRESGRRALRRLLVVLSLGLVPWTLVAGRDLTFVFSFGLLNDNPWYLVWLPDYLQFSAYGRSAAIESWLVGVGIYAAAVLSALSGLAGWDDRRLTGGLLVLAGLSQFPLAWSFSRRPATLGLPVGSVLLLVAAWWLYAPAFTTWITERID